MANLEFRDKHNMVAFLKKPQGSEDFHQIVDFLNASHIRRHLKLAYADGISTLPTTKFFEQLALMGHVQARPERLSNFPMNHHKEKVTTLENELKCTKAVYNKALITLTKRVKKLEKKLKHKRRRVVVDSLYDEEASLDKEDSPKQGRVIKEIDKDNNVNLIKISKQMEAHETVRHRIESDDTKVVDFSTASPQKDDDEINLAETLVILKRVKQKIKDDVQAHIQADKDLAQRMLEEERESTFYEEEQVQLLKDEEYAQQVQAQWVSDEAGIAQENLA
nr:hypothetical protein [Tanacetum cinerariifolium]